MTKELSNKTMAILIFIAILISIIGILTTQPAALYMRMITGMATNQTSDTGMANATVGTLLSINLTTDNITWGSGSVATGSGNCTLCTNTTPAECDKNINASNSGCWDFNNITTGLVLENQGNTWARINVSFNENTSSWTAWSSSTQKAFKWFAASIGGVNCKNNTFGDTGSVFPNTPTSVLANKTNISCGALNYDDDNDEYGIDFVVAVPSDASSGSVGTTVTVTATVCSCGGSCTSANTCV